MYIDLTRILSRFQPNASYETEVSIPGGPCHKSIRILYQYPNPRLLQEIGNLNILTQSQRHKILTVNHTSGLPKRPPINILHHRLLPITISRPLKTDDRNIAISHNLTTLLQPAIAPQQRYQIPQPMQH